MGHMRPAPWWGIWMGLVSLCGLVMLLPSLGAEESSPERLAAGHALSGDALALYHRRHPATRRCPVGSRWAHAPFRRGPVGTRGPHAPTRRQCTPCGASRQLVPV